MTTEQLKRLHERKPFEPFVLFLADGRDVPIDHPELLALSKSGRTIQVVGLDEREEIIDLLLVVSLKVAGTERPGLRSGRQRT